MARSRGISASRLHNRESSSAASQERKGRYDGDELYHKDQIIAVHGTGIVFELEFRRLSQVRELLSSLIHGD